MKAYIYLNNEPMVWITVDEDLEGNLEVKLSPEFHDYLISVSDYKKHLWNSTIPNDYFDRENEKAIENLIGRH